MRKVSQSRMLPGTHRRTGPSFWLGFGNWACGESNIRKSVLTLPPSLSLKLSVPLTMCVPSLSPSFLLCSLWAVFSFISWLLIFFNQIFSLGQALLPKALPRSYEAHSPVRMVLCFRRRCWLLSMVTASWRRKSYQKNQSTFSVIGYVVSWSQWYQEWDIKSSCILELLRIWKQAIF